MKKKKKKFKQQQVFFFFFDNNWTGYHEEKMAILADIVEISESFISTALNYGKIIISEAFMPDHLRTVKPTTPGGLLFVVVVFFQFVFDNWQKGQLGGRKYICRGILVM